MLPFNNESLDILRDLLLPTLLQLEEPLEPPPCASVELLCLSKDFLGTLSNSFEDRCSIDLLSRDFASLTDDSCLSVRLPECEVFEGLISVSKVVSVLQITFASGGKDVLVIENLETFGETILTSSTTCCMKGFWVLGDFIGEGKSSSVSVTLRSRLSTFLSDFKGSNVLCGEYLDRYADPLMVWYVFIGSEPGDWFEYAVG